MLIDDGKWLGKNIHQLLEADHHSMCGSGYQVLISWDEV